MLKTLALACAKMRFTAPAPYVLMLGALLVLLPLLNYRLAITPQVMWVLFVALALGFTGLFSRHTSDDEAGQMAESKDQLMQEPSDSSLLEMFSRKYAITRREQEVLQLILEGCDTMTISSKLCISENTIKSHVRQLLRKTATHNRIGLAARFLQEKELVILKSPSSAENL